MKDINNEYFGKTTSCKVCKKCYLRKDNPRYCIYGGPFGGFILQNPIILDDVNEVITDIELAKAKDAFKYWFGENI